jgi:hypothetical protein
MPTNSSHQAACRTTPTMFSALQPKRQASNW